MPRIGQYGSRPIHVANTGGGWQATCKIPPGLEAGWHNAALRTSGSGFSAPLRIGIDMVMAARRAARPAGDLRLARVADGKSFEDRRIRVGQDSAISVWAAGLPEDVSLPGIRVRLDGTELPAIWMEGAAGNSPRQINALLPAGLEAGPAVVSLAAADLESDLVDVELYRN